jgi:hypothetical protein
MTRAACSPPHSRVSPPSCLQSGLDLSAVPMKGRSRGVSYGETADRCKKSKASQLVLRCLPARELQLAQNRNHSRRNRTAVSEPYSLHLVLGKPLPRRSSGARSPGPRRPRTGSRTSAIARSCRRCCIARCGEASSASSRSRISTSRGAVSRTSRSPARARRRGICRCIRVQTN